MDELKQMKLGKRLTNPIQDTQFISHQIDNARMARGEFSFFPDKRGLDELLDATGISIESHNPRHDAANDAEYVAKLLKEERGMAVQENILPYRYIPEVGEDKKIRYK